MIPPAPADAWSVSRLASSIKRRVEEGFEPVWVRGEVVGVKRYPSGHVYFGLRDATAKVDCTMWKFAAQRLTQPLEEGAEVFLLGTASVWEERTALRFNVTQLVPAAAVGAQAQAVERIRQALAADGLLDPARKRPLPAYPRRIAVVTSLAGAVIRDIITVASRRWPGIELLVVNSAVQGAAAPADLVAALATVALIPDIDCCIVGRGGGVGMHYSDRVAGPHPIGAESLEGPDRERGLGLEPGFEFVDVFDQARACGRGRRAGSGRRSSRCTGAWPG